MWEGKIALVLASRIICHREGGTSREPPDLFPKEGDNQKIALQTQIQAVYENFYSWS